MVSLSGHLATRLWCVVVLLVVLVEGRDRSMEMRRASESLTRDEVLAQREHRKDEFEHRLHSLEDQLRDSPDDPILKERVEAYRTKFQSLAKDLDDRRVDRLSAKEIMFEEASRA